MSDTGSDSTEESGINTYRYYFCKYLTPIRTAVDLLTVLGRDLNAITIK